jgi:hypothetical protein
MNDDSAERVWNSWTIVGTPATGQLQMSAMIITRVTDSQHSFTFLNHSRSATAVVVQCFATSFAVLFYGKAVLRLRWNFFGQKYGSSGIGN